MEFWGFYILTWILLKFMSMSQWYHATISSSVTPFSSCLQFFPTSRPFPTSQLFTSGPKYCSFSFSISPSNEYSRLISFRVDWFDLLAVQETLKSLLQHHSMLHFLNSQRLKWGNYPWHKHKSRIKFNLKRICMFLPSSIYLHVPLFNYLTPVQR